MLKERNVPLLINQPAYNLFNRWAEKDLFAASDDVGAGVIAFTPLAQGLPHQQVSERHPGRRSRQPAGW